MFNEISLALNNKCSLSCDYCFLEDKGMQEMNLWTAAHVCNFVREHVKPHGGVFFFATEPLKSWDLLVTLHSQMLGERNDLDFGITTNGMEITEEIAEYLAYNKIGVLLSMDGSSLTHNRFRGNHDQVLAGYHTLQKVGITPGIACSVVPEYVPFLRFMVKYLSRLNPQFVALNKVTANWDTPWDWTKLRHALYDTYRWTIQNDPDLLKFQWSYTHDYLTLEKANVTQFQNKERYSCGACYGGIGINYDGTLYPCQAMDSFKYPIGNVYTGLDQPSVEHLRSLDARECHYCTVPGCGFCYKVNWLKNGILNQPDDDSCRWESIRWETTKRVIDELSPKQYKELETLDQT